MLIGNTTRLGNLEFTASVKSDDLEKLWGTLATATGATVSGLMRERAGMMGRYLASATMPVVLSGDSVDGDSKEARIIGQKAAQKMLRAMFSKVRDIRPHLTRTDLAICTAMNGKTFLAQREKVITDAATLKNTHQRYRRYSRQKPQQQGFIVLATIYEAYEKHILSRVGWAKSGWMTAASSVSGAKGTTQAPKWMRQNAPGNANDLTNDEENPTYFLNNEVPYVSEIFSGYQVAKAEDRFETSLANELRRRIKYLTKAA
ncbi:MAG: hypothetical protein EBR82_19120 [Caulobacteraceae bacterium]|nr:hypothetical protein [Caulobacteraceae bacterium]